MELAKQSKKQELILTKSEENFLTALTDPFVNEDLKNLTEVGGLCGLRPDDVAYIMEWVVHQGIHWLSCAEAGLDEVQGAKIFRNPVVRKIINKAAELGYCQATSALKEELEDYYSQRLRNPFMPEVLRDNAARELAKMKGYYPKETASGSGNTLVQINMVNPYAEVEVKSECE
jgi:hypothetical protein